MSPHAEALLDAYRKFWAGTVNPRLLSICTSPDYRQLPDHTELVRKAVECIEQDIARRNPTLPTFNPDFGTVSMPAIWGGKIIPASNGGGVFIEPIAQTIHDFATLPDPQDFENSDFGLALQLYRDVQSRVNEPVFVRTPDLQGPLNTLGLLVDQTDLILSMYESPDRVHDLLTQITDVLIRYLRRYLDTAGPQNVVGNVWPWIVLPDGRGIGITQDFMPLLNAELYAEFELPQLKRMADAFGGVFIHCCGEFAQHLPTLARADFKIWGIETHYPCTKLWDAHAALGDSLAYVPYIAPTGKAEFPRLSRLLEALSVHGMHDARVWVCVADTWAEDDVDALKKWEASHTPSPCNSAGR